MNTKSLVAIALFVAAGSAAAADQNFPSVQVSARAPIALEFSCDNLATPAPADVAQILKLNDHSQTGALSSKLMGAVAEACNAGVSNIVVHRGANGRSLSWSAASQVGDSIALN